MKLFNHPIHVMLIHFPAALLPMDLVFSALGYYYELETLYTTAFFCLAGGVILGYLAVLTGLIDLPGLQKERKEVMNAALIHGLVNGSVILTYTFVLYKEWQAYPLVSSPSIVMLVLKLILVVTLLLGNFLGGKLIYKHQVGIDKAA